MFCRGLYFIIIIIIIAIFIIIIIIIAINISVGDQQMSLNAFDCLTSCLVLSACVVLCVSLQEKTLNDLKL